MTSNALDAVIAGGGPAGMMAAITAAARGRRVLLIEKNDRLVTAESCRNCITDYAGEKWKRGTWSKRRFRRSTVPSCRPIASTSTAGEGSM